MRTPLLRPPHPHRPTDSSAGWLGRRGAPQALFSPSSRTLFAFAKSANMLDNGSRAELPNTCYMAKSKRPGDPTAWGEAVPMDVEGSRAGPHYAGVRAKRTMSLCRCVRRRS